MRAPFLALVLAAGCAGEATLDTGADPCAGLDDADALESCLVESYELYRVSSTGDTAAAPDGHRHPRICRPGPRPDRDTDAAPTRPPRDTDAAPTRPPRPPRDTDTRPPRPDPDTGAERPDRPRCRPLHHVCHNMPVDAPPRLREACRRLHQAHPHPPRP